MNSIYALLGKSLSHSFSRSWFEAKFREENLACEYINLELSELTTLRQIVRDLRLSGFNVTIPYKSIIIPFLDELDPIAEETGAVNTVKCRDDGTWIGFNTDVTGFRETLRTLLRPERHKALILGTGGAAKAVKYACNELGLENKLVSRKAVGTGVLTYTELDEVIIREFKVIINTTPLGTFPDVYEKPDLPYEGITSGHLLYDLVYNPSETSFMKEGSARGARVMNGYPMLVRQAEESWAIWTGNRAT